MSAAEISALATSISALIGVLTVLFAQIGHLMSHRKADRKAAAQARGGNGTSSRP